MGVITAREAKRKIPHLSAGTLLALLFYAGIIERIHFALLFIVLAGIFLLYVLVKIPILHAFVKTMEREEERELLPGIGALFLVLGMNIAVWLFSPAIATATLLILSWGDSIAALAGPYGTHPYLNPKKTWEGILAAVVTATLVASFAVPFTPALIASTIAMLIEGLDLKIGSWRIDDNVLIPLVAGTVIALMGQFA